MSPYLPWINFSREILLKIIFSYFSSKKRIWPLMVIFGAIMNKYFLRNGGSVMIGVNQVYFLLQIDRKTIGQAKVCIFTFPNGWSSAVYLSKYYRPSTPLTP
jgi:hypothetical protein